MDYQNLLKKILDSLGFLSEDEKISLTNVAVIIFVSITAFRCLFAGMIIKSGAINWTVEQIDIASTLPMLFSLINYAHKRDQINKMNATQTDSDKENK